MRIFIYNAVVGKADKVYILEDIVYHLTVEDAYEMLRKLQKKGDPNKSYECSLEERYGEAIRTTVILLFNRKRQ